MRVKTYGRLTVRAVRVLRDVERAERWLKAPSRILEGRTPLEAAETAEGAARVEKQLDWFAGTRPRGREGRP